MESNFEIWLIAAAVIWWVFARPPRHLSQREYGEWYRTRFLNGLYWQTFRRFRRAVGFGICAHWWKGGCRGPIHVHHRTWAYRWLFYEWLIWPFGTVLLCDRHHSRIHRRKNPRQK